MWVLGQQFVRWSRPSDLLAGAYCKAQGMATFEHAAYLQVWSRDRIGVDSGFMNETLYDPREMSP